MKKKNIQKRKLLRRREAACDFLQKSEEGYFLSDVSMYMFKQRGAAVTQWAGVTDGSPNGDVGVSVDKNRNRVRFLKHTEGNWELPHRCGH